MNTQTATNQSATAASQAHAQGQSAPKPQTNGAASGEAHDAPTISREFLIAKDTKVDIDFPVKFRAGHRLSAPEAAQLHAHYHRGFTTNLNAQIERQNKRYTPDEVLALWQAYELGAPREGTGQTLHDQAVMAFMREYAKNHNMVWPTAGEILKQSNIAIRKATDAQKEDAQTKCDAQVDALFAKFNGSTNAGVVAGIKAHEDRLRAAREAAKATTAPTLRLDAASLDI